MKVAIGIFCLGKTCGEIRTRCQKKMAVFRQNLEKEERQEERKEGGRGKKEGGKERRKEGKKEGEKERRERRNVNVFFMLKRNCILSPPPAPKKGGKERRKESKNAGKKFDRKFSNRGLGFASQRIFLRKISNSPCLHHCPSSAQTNSRIFGSSFGHEGISNIRR